MEKFKLKGGKTIKVTADQVADYLENEAREDSKRKGKTFNANDYYCGITNDCERRENDHSSENIAEVRTLSRAEAGEVEKVMDSRGFDVGERPDNGGRKDSCWVYVYAKDSQTDP